MNGFFITPNLYVAAYVLTKGAPYPTTRADESDKPGVVSFAFEILTASGNARPKGSI